MAPTVSTGTTPGGRGRFEGFDVLEQVRTWDDETRAVVLARLGPLHAPAFFGAEEEACARALLDRILAQEQEPRVPVFEMIDARLAAGVGDGWRYADMPEDGDAWRRSLRALDRDARARHGRSFCRLDSTAQKDVVDAVQDADGEWEGLPAKHVFDLWMRYACAAFYSHPWAWNEIGFGGPAYPRGYENLGIDKRERWERPERDAEDPVPWVERAETARRAHEAPPPEPGGPRPAGSEGSEEASHDRQARAGS
ncbi:MAG TPA: gluconate 2-dehydrogenase subunit 3 family protein [Acidimicrobiia bacterium]